VAQPARDEQRLPPGQTPSRSWPVLHYGPVPRFRPETWDLRVFGATAADEPTTWRYDDVRALPRTEVVADLHCVTKFSILGVRWGGMPTTSVLELVPPAPEATHVLVWAEYGYSANLRIDDLADPSTLLATHRDGEALTPERGWPLRLVVPRRYAWKGPKWVRGIEYLVGDRRGFWEERGYHNGADPWLEERYSYQEDDAGD
jgi:DMSO/TMAO reductase YedYZ molybdopterin-dependent catalytic subunit